MGRGIALPFHDLGLFTPGEEPVTNVQETGWAPGLVWTGAGKSRPPPGLDPRTVQQVASRYIDPGPRAKLDVKETVNNFITEKNKKNPFLKWYPKWGGGRSCKNSIC